MSDHQVPSSKKSPPAKEISHPAEPSSAHQIYEAICQLLATHHKQTDPKQHILKTDLRIDWAATSPKEWQILAHLAEGEGVASLLYWDLVRNAVFDGSAQNFNSEQRNTIIKQIPPNVQDFFHRSYDQTTIRNMVFFNELERILVGLEQAQIPAIVVKDAAFARLMYPDPGLRPLNKLNLLIKLDSLDQAIHTLQTLGYIEEKITDHANLYGGPQGQVLVEMDWCLVTDGKGRSPNLEWLWAQTQPYTPDNHYAQFLQPQAQFVHFTGHLMLQTDPSRRRLIEYFDLRQLYELHLQSTNLDILFQTEEVACWTAWLQAVLYQLRDLFGVWLPPTLTGNLEQAPYQQE